MASQHTVRVGNQMATWDPELVPDERGRTRSPVPDCPVEVALAAISGRWTTLVLRELTHGPRSFSDLRAALPALSAKVLSSRLQTLTTRGLAERILTNGFPVRASYRLTDAGHQLRPLLIALYTTGSAMLASQAD